MLTDALLSSALTHNAPTSNASCVAFTAMLSELARMESPPRQEWWVARFVELARPMEGRVRLKSRAPAGRFEGSLCDFLEQFVQPAIRGPRSLIELLDSWHSGAFLLETVPSALAVLARCAADSETAIVRAASDTWDNDRIAAFVGAAAGALLGELALPERWRKGLSGCTEREDDGRLFELLVQLDRRVG
jgi:ADP-ribosylglycohydrolase